MTAYRNLHRVTLADEIEQAEAEMARKTHTRPARIDEPDTVITDFGGMAEARPNIVRRAFDSESTMEQQSQDDLASFGHFVLHWLAYPALSLVILFAWLMGWLS